jgi:MFS family permease
MGLLGTMSAIGTALGPSLGGALIAGPGWRAIFLINLPLGAMAFVLARRCLPADASRKQGNAAGFDHVGMLALTMTLAAYALAMTLGRGSFGPINLALLAGAVLGAIGFVRVERIAGSPLIRPGMLHDPVLAASLAMSALVTTVMMATLVVGPFYLSIAFGLDAAGVGLVLSAGPVAAALAGVPAGLLADRLGAPRMVIAGLGAMAAGCAALASIPLELGLPGYIAPSVVVTVGYAIFQAANNSVVMADVLPDQRGVVSGILNLSRNLGLVTGASVMGAVFAFASGTVNIMTAPAQTVAGGMRITFAVATVLIAAALAVAAKQNTRPAIS